MKQYFRLFSKKGEDFTRYWASISTKTEDDEFVSANITVRMSKNAEKVYTDSAEKTKTKGIKTCVVESNDFWLKAVQPKDDDAQPFVILFINSCKILEKDEEEDD